MPRGKPLGLRGERVLVLGLGLHGGGTSVVRWLCRQGARVTVTDLKTHSQLAPCLRQLRGLKVRYVLGRHPSSLLAHCDRVIQNPGVPRELPLLRAARGRGIPLENEATLFLDRCPTLRLVGVTGSKGKSTTATLLGAMLSTVGASAMVAGNIRDTLMLDVLPRLRATTPVVLELSSWQLELVAEHGQSLPVAVVTNVFPEHLDRYASFAAYARAKTGIFLNQGSRGVAVLNYGNATTRSFARRAPGRVVWFSLTPAIPRGSQGVVVQAGWVVFLAGARKVRLCKVSNLALPGRHNLENVLAAAAAAHVLGAPTSAIRRAVVSFRGLHDRMELVRTYRGVRYVNDTTATAPAATAAALAALAGSRVVLIAGGADKALPYKELARLVRRREIPLVLLPGDATAKLQRALGSCPQQFLVQTMPAAVALAAKLAPPGATVLLSPAAASFGLFTHEFDRGAAFRRSVLALGRKPHAR